jgi:hypothetical protein
MYSSKDGQIIFGQPGFIILRWVSPFFIMFILSSMSSNPETECYELNPSSSEKSSGSDKLSVGVSGNRLRGCFVLFMKKYIRSSTV